MLTKEKKEMTAPALPDYDSPAALKVYLEEHGMAMQKKFGQNFLVNGAVRRRLIDALEVQENTSVWEIGPGLGAMTEELLNRGAQLTAFEIDRGFCAVLRNVFAGRNNFTLIEGDVLKTWKKQQEIFSIPDRLFGNLPYNIAATVIAEMIGAGVRFDKIVITVQKEVGQRMSARPSTHDYSSFSVLCQWAYTVSPIMDLAGGSFWPRPNVDSRAVKLEKRPDWPGCREPVFFIKLQKALFASRRKTVKNNLTVFFNSREKAFEVLLAAHIDPEIRAECLSVEEILALCNIADTILASDV